MYVTIFNCNTVFFFLIFLAKQNRSMSDNEAAANESGSEETTQTPKKGRGRPKKTEGSAEVSNALFIIKPTIPIAGISDAFPFHWDI